MLVWRLLVCVLIPLCDVGSVTGASLSHPHNTLHYITTVESSVFDQESINSTIKFTLEPLTVKGATMVEDWHLLHLTSITHTIQSHNGEVIYPTDTLQHKVYFSSSPSGIIQRLYHPKEELEEVVHVKKYLLSALSGHLQEDNTDEWEYVLEELDHAGKGNHYYRAQKTTEGTQYHRRKRMDPSIPHLHEKKFTVDHEGKITSVHSHENLIMYKDTSEGEDNGMGYSTEQTKEIQSKIHIRLLYQSPLDSVKEISWTELNNYVSESLELNMEEKPKRVSLEEATQRVQRGLQCAHKHSPESSLRAQCVMGIRKAVNGLNSGDLRKLSLKFLDKPCSLKEKVPRHCQHDRDVLIDVLARVESAEAQRVVLRIMKENIQSEVQRCLFHLTAATEPIKEVVEAVAQMCFGDNMKNHGILHLSGNQKRACLTLGALLHHHAQTDNQRTEELLEHLHTWLDTDKQMEHNFDSKVLRDPRDTSANTARQHFVHSKTVLLHVLGNAGHPKSRKVIAEYAEPNLKHSDLRHTAMKALRHFTCDESATLLLNATLNDGDDNVKSAAREVYMQHPRAGELSHTAQNILISKEPRIIHHLRQERSILCNLIDDLTLDYRIDFPGFDWSKKVGNDFIGASFGVKIINFAHMHLSPVTMFFELNIDNRAWIDSWVELFKKRTFDIFNAEVCYKRAFRMYNISTTVDWNVVDILKEYESFDEIYEEVIQPLIDSVNSFSDLLDVWNDTLGHIDLGLGVNDVVRTLMEKEENITARVDDLKYKGEEWVNETFGGVMEFVQEVRELKADVINRVGEINDTVRSRVQEFAENVQSRYEEAIRSVEDSVNEYLQSLGVDFELQFLDECIATVDLIELIQEPEKTGEEVVACLKEKVEEKLESDVGLMGQMNKLIRTVREMQEKFQNITDKIEKVKLLVEDVKDNGWKVLVKKLLERHQGFIDEMAAAMLNFVNGILDDMGMNLQYVVNSIDKANRFIENAVKLMKDAPNGAIADITRGQLKMRVSQALFERLKEKFELDGSELQGKISSWMETGMELKGLIRGLENAVEKLKQAQNVKETFGNLRSAGSMRDKLEILLKESAALEGVTPLLEDLVEDLRGLTYMADLYKDSFTRVTNGMKKAKQNFETLKRRAETAKELIQKVFGIKFHKAYPKQVKTECDDNCGGCGIYPNIMRGRRGVQLLAEAGGPIVAPFDSRVVPIEGSSDSLMIYPTGADMNDYEIVVTFIKPLQEIFDYPHGLFVDAGMVIGEALTSPCQPNFIHTAIRKLNSTVQAESSSPFGIERSRTIPKPRDDSACGSKDLGEYVPADDFYDTPDPMPKYLEGCSKVDFRHIFQYFDIEDLSTLLEEFELDWDQLAEDVGERLEKQLERMIEFPPVDWLVIDKLMPNIEDAAWDFTYDLIWKVNEPFKDIQYKFDELGNWVREISFNLPEAIPKISDFFNTMNFTVEEFGQFLLDAGLSERADKLLGIVGDLGSLLDGDMCQLLSKVKPSKLRWETLKDGGQLNGAKDTLKGQMEKLKLKGCDMILTALSKSESHFCEVDPDSSCQLLQCITKNKFDDRNIEIPVGIGFDPCNMNIKIGIGLEEITVELDGANLVTTVTLSVAQVNHINITADIVVEYNVLTKNVTVDVILRACHTYLPMCFGYSPVFKKLTFEITTRLEEEDRRCLNISRVLFPCQNGSSSQGSFSLHRDMIEGEIKQWKMEDFLYSLDRFNLSRGDVNGMLDEARVAVLEKLTSLTSMKSSIEGKELFRLPDLKTEDKILKGPFDIPFFKIPFKFPPLSLSIEAGGVITVALDFALNVLSSNATIIPKPSIGAYAEADGKASIVVTAVGLKLRGTLLETIFNLILDVRWSEYPIEVVKTLRVDLIPLGVDFKGYWEILKIPFELTIFTWKAPLMKGEPDITEDLVHDETAPFFEWESNQCLVEQVLARHWSDPAFYLEAPFYDPESLLHLQYAIGTYRDGTDVLGWTDMEGVAMIVPIQLRVTGLPLHFTVRATNTDNKQSIVYCILDTYDVTPATGRFEAAHIYTSHPSKLSGTLMVIEDSPLIEEQYTGVGVGRGYYGDQSVHWYLFDLDKDPINKEGEGELAHFAAGRQGRLTSPPIRSSTIKYDHECAKECNDLGDGCASFDFDYGTDTCDLHWTIEGKAAELVLKGAYHNFEKLGAGYTAYFSYEGLELLQAEVYYLNARITNVRGYESYLTSHEIVVDFTCPKPGPIGEYKLDVMRHDNCSAAITQGERCIEVTPHPNHRHIIDGPGASTVFNGNFPRVDLQYTISNHYLTANWDGFHDDETDIWGYTWAAGTSDCSQDIQEWDDPHSHLADKSYWTHQGLSSDLLLPDGPYFVTVQALNSVIFGGALVTSVCHSTPIIVDTTAPWLDFVEDIFYDEDFDLLGVYYKASDPESGIMRTDIGLGETKHDVFVRAYSRHDPLHDGYEMVSVDGVDLPLGVAVWVRVRVVNNVEMLTADHAKQPLMMDPTPPVPGSVLDGDVPLVNLDYQPEDDRICVQWYDWFDPESGIERFLWGIGTSQNETDVMEFVEYSHYERSACTDIALNHSATYYNIIRAYNQAINSRAAQKASDGVMVDITEPLAGWVNDGEDPSEDIEYSSQAASLYSHWGDFHDPESGIQEYIVTLSVNGEDREEFIMTGDEEYLEDHTQHLQHSDFVKVTVEAENGATLKTESQSSGYVIDLTPPDVVFVKDHPQGLRYQVSDSEVYAHWQFEDLESHIKEYKLRILENKAGNSFQMWPTDTKYKIYTPADNTDTEFEVTIDDLELENGVKYSVEVTAINNAVLGSRQESLGVIVDTTPPVMSKIYIGNFGADENLNDENEIMHDDHHGIQASWVGYDHESGIIKFMVAVGTEEGDTSVSGGFRDFGTEPDGYIDGILLNVTADTGELYYVSIYAMNGAGVQSEILTSKPIHVYGENTPGVVYDGRELYVDKDYTTDAVTLAISFQGFDSPACGIRGYEWALGSQPGYSDILPYSSYGIVMLNTSHAITEIHLPLEHGDAVYASVRAHTGHGCKDDILHSCSDGILVDTKPPEIVFVTLGKFGNETDSEISDEGALFQMEYDSIALAWNTTDEASGVQNDTWMAGSVPLQDDKHPAAATTDRQIPIRAVSMETGETVIFSVIATDLAGNVREAVAPALTVDVTEPLIEGFKCSEYLSVVQTEVSCTWTHTLDHESPLVEQRLAIGERQLEEQIVAFETLPYGQYSWTRSLDNVFDRMENKTRAFVTLQVVNEVGLIASALARITIDRTVPEVGQTFITTPVTPGESVEVKVCQQSVSTMEVRWDLFQDKESGIKSYEVGVGTGPGKSDIADYRSVGAGNSVFLDRLPLIPGTQAFASVRAVNHARLVSASVSSSVHISPSPRIHVLDGLGDQDVDYQNDLSSISGKVRIDQPCPIEEANWWAFDLLGNEVVNQSEFFNNQFANDELELVNFRTYYTVVEIRDAINRTLKGKSDGVLTFTQPPRPGEVRDGPYPGEDRNYQESTEQLSVNWDPFGSEDDPLQTITHYQVALGDNPGYAETRTNVHYYVDVGLALNYTFNSLRLTSKRVEYFATVRGYSESGAHVDSVSNGIKVGYSAGIEMGEVHLSRYSNSSNALRFYWDRFVSDFRVIHYRWGIGTTAFAEDNVTLPCSDLLPLVKNWATVQSLVDEKQDRFAEKKDLNLEHAKDYYLIVVAEDEAGQCISSNPNQFTVDMTPPDKGIIRIDGIGTHIQYTTSSDTLRVKWEGYKDDESGIADFYLQLFNESNCLGSDPETWTPVSEPLDVKNTFQHTYLSQYFKPDIPYRILITVTNQASSITVDWSTAIFLDMTAPEKGVIKDGIDWTQTKYYQSSTTELEAVFAVSPLGSSLDCPLIRFLVPVDETNNDVWLVMDNLSLEDTEGGYYEDIYLEYYQRNIHQREDGALVMSLHYNISTLHLEGGSMLTETLPVLEGDYTFNVQISGGEHAVFSVTLSDGFMDEYVDFEPPVVEDQPTDEEFFEHAKDADIDFDRDLDVTLASTESPPRLTTVDPRPTTDGNDNITDPGSNYRDGFETNALGVHFLGFPAGNKTKVWTLLFWARDTEGIKSNWIYLTFDPTQELATYTFKIERDHSTVDIRWNVIFTVNGERVSDMTGINLPHNYTAKIRYWSHDKVVPEFVDPFHPYFTSTVIKDFTVPVPRERPCQFGKAFYDMESAVQRIFVGVGNTSHSDNIVPYNLAYELCHSCNLPCDHYKCSEDCNPELEDGYLILKAHLTNLTLDPGDFETEEEIFSKMRLYEQRQFSDYEVDLNDTAYISNRYYILVKAINEAGLEELSVSPGVQIDVTPPVLIDIGATDPEYDPFIVTEYQWSNNSLAGWWDFEDKQSPIFEYKVAIGTVANATDVQPFISVGTETSVIVDNLDGLLKEAIKYYITVEAINAARLSTFASTNGVYIFTSAPDVSNTTSEPLNSVKWPADDPENAVYITDSQDEIGVRFDGNLADNVHKLEWGTGESVDDTYITSRVEVDRRLYDWSTLAVKDDGYFWFGGEKSDTHLTWLSQKAAQINMTLDSEYIDPGHLWLEPGRCVYHHLYAQNMAHLTSLIDVTPVCIKRPVDHVVVTNGGYSLEYTSGTTTISLSGTGDSGVLFSTRVDQALYEAEYGSSANITLRPYIVNPVESMKNTSRVMSRRLLNYTEIAILVSPMPVCVLTEPLQITLSYTGVSYDPANNSLAILYWDTALLKWFDVEESSGQISQVNPDTETITGWYAGPVQDEISNVSRSRRSEPDARFHLETPHMFAVYVVEGSHMNSPPILLSRILRTERDTALSMQLRYYDPEDDEVEFSISVEPRRGTANLTADGWLIYEPNPLFFGEDVMTVVLNETNLPVGIEGNSVEEVIRIQVRETPVAPALFLELDEELTDGGTPWRTFTETVTLQFEANTTLKSIGTLFVCDLNPQDDLDLIWQNQDNQNVSVVVTEMSVSSSGSIGNYKTLRGQCIDTNVKTYGISVETLLSYHGDNIVTFIGQGMNSDNLTMFSQPIRVHVYSLYSPCGHYGVCTSNEDPNCDDNQRSQSFESYSCTCDNWHNGAWCDILDVLKITLITVGSCWLLVLVLIGLLKYRDSYKSINRVEPFEEVVKLDNFEETEHSESSSGEDDGSNGESDANGDKGESVATVTLASAAATPARYQREFRSEAKKYWTEPSGQLHQPDEVVSSKAKPAKNKKKKIKKIKKSKVSTRETHA